MNHVRLGAGAVLMVFIAMTAGSASSELQTSDAPDQRTEQQSGSADTQAVQERETRKVAPQQNRTTLPQAGRQQGDQQKSPTKAKAVLFPIADSGVSGLITIEKQDGDRVSITGTVRGLEPNSKHGFHIHEYGDLSDLEKGQSVGGHFAPHGSPHGRQDAEPDQRHVGDLGNIEANDDGVAEIQIEDKIVQLHGQNNVLGRAFVVHAKEDQFTQPSGDAGDRLAFGTIGIAESSSASQR